MSVFKRLVGSKIHVQTRDNSHWSWGEFLLCIHRTGFVTHSYLQPADRVKFYSSSLLPWTFFLLSFPHILMDFLGGSDSKESALSAGDWVWFLGQEDPLEKGIAFCSSILAWRIPWTKEPGGLQSMGSQRARHNWATKTHTYQNIGHEGL